MLLLSFVPNAIEFYFKKQIIDMKENIKFKGRITIKKYTEHNKYFSLSLETGNKTKTKTVCYYMQVVFLSIWVIMDRSVVVVHRCWQK